MERAPKTELYVDRSSLEGFILHLCESGLLQREEIDHALANTPLPPDVSQPTPEGIAQQLVTSGKLTEYQAKTILAGKASELLVGNYEVLDRLGAGGMGTVFKARHRRMKRIV